MYAQNAIFRAGTLRQLVHTKRNVVRSYVVPGTTAREVYTMRAPGFNTGRLRPEVQPLTLFYIPFWQKRYPFYIPFIEERYPFDIFTLENCTPFPSPYNEVNEQYYGKISSIIRRNAKQRRSVIYSLHAVKRPISLPFYIPQLVKSLPFYIPEA